MTHGEGGKNSQKSVTNYLNGLLSYKALEGSGTDNSYEIPDLFLLSVSRQSIIRESINFRIQKAEVSCVDFTNIL